MFIRHLKQSKEYDNALRSEERKLTPKKKKRSSPPSHSEQVATLYSSLHSMSFFPFTSLKAKRAHGINLSLSALQQVLSANFHCYSCIFVVRKPCSWCMDTRIFHTVDL